MLTTLATELKPLFTAQGRLIRLPADRETIYVGDTHGDRDATERILDRWLNSSRTIVFLGDTVDRGPDSRGNLMLILEAKREHPEAVYLLMGNHEGWAFARFFPADFWYGLAEEEESTLSDALAALPYAAWHPAGLLSTHGGLPNVDSLDAIERIEPGTPAWRDITWGDWSAGSPHGLEAHNASRPMYDEGAFVKRMEHLNARIHVRSHQPSAPLHLYGSRCLTLFSTSAYGTGERLVARLDPTRPCQTTRDLDLLPV
jgi:hypothetical protein